MNNVVDLTQIDNPVREQNELQLSKYKKELQQKGGLSVAFNKSSEPLEEAISVYNGKHVVNVTLFSHKFLNMFSIYAHNSLGGQFLYDDETGLWNDLDIPDNEYAVVGIYHMLIKPMFYRTLLQDDNTGQLTTALQKAAQEIAGATKAQGIGTGLGQYKNDGLVLFNDGRVYDFDLQDVRRVKKEDYMTKRFEYPIVENDDGGAIKEWLDFVLQDSAKAFYEYIGSSFIQRPIYNVFAFAVNGLIDENVKSNGGNGKSEVLSFIANHVFGKENSATLSLPDLLQADDRKIINLHQKFLNIDSETPETFINDTSKLKGLTGTGARTIDRKYKSSITMENRAKLLFATNNVPQFRDDSSAMERRLMIIPFNRDFKGKDAEEGRKWYSNELKALRQSDTELGKFAYYCIKQFEALYNEKGVSANNPFSMSETAIKLRDKTINDNNPAKHFIDECSVIEFTDDKECMVPQGVVYDMYLAYHKLTNTKTVNKPTFKKYLDDFIPAGDGNIKANGKKRMFHVTSTKAYQGIKFVKANFETDADKRAFESLEAKFQNSIGKNIFDDIFYK